MGLTIKDNFIHIYLYHLVLLVIIFSSSVLLSNNSIIAVSSGNAKHGNTGSNIFTTNQNSQINTNEKITSSNSLNSSFNFLFTNTGSYTITDIVIDSLGNKYLTGFTYADNLITKNAFNDTYGGYGDFFVAKLSPNNSLIFSTYLGSDESSSVNTLIAVDSAGNVYVTGCTSSSNFPTKNAFNSTYSGNEDSFVTEFSSNGTIIFSTFLGGNSTDYSTGITVDGNGNVYVTGATSSSDFPTKNAFDSTYSGTEDTFVTEFSSNGTILFSTFLGGSRYAYSSGIAVDSAGNVYVTGTTSSSDFPTKNAINSVYTPSADVFVTKFSSKGNILFSTFLGGNGNDKSSGIAIDSAGNVYVTGTTSSSDFPTKNAVNSVYAGSADVFVTEFSSNGIIIFSTYLGGNGNDESSGIAMDSAGNYYILGFSRSSNFPVINSPYPASNSTFGYFITKFSLTNKILYDFIFFYDQIFVTNNFILATDSESNFYIVGSFNSNSYSPNPANILIFNSNGKFDSQIYLSGQFQTTGKAITIDKAGNKYITGEIEKFTSINSVTHKFSFNRVNAYVMNVYVLKLNSSGNLDYITYLGGNSTDYSSGIAVDSAGNVYVTGTTSSSDFPAKNAVNSTYGGNGDAFVTKLNPNGNVVFSTFIGGSASDVGNGIAVDSDGNCYVTGETFSSNFLIQNTPIDTHLASLGISYGHGSAFLTKLNSTGALVFSTYFGGFNNDDGESIAVDNAGNVYLSGWTVSSDFPMKNAFNSTFTNTFLAKFNSKGQLEFSTYIGESQRGGTGIAVDQTGNVLVAGFTTSNAFPIKNPFNISFDGSDIFISKYNSQGDLVFSSFLHFTDTNLGTSVAVAVDRNSNYYITGYTSTTAIDNIFVTKINSSNKLVYSSLFSNGDAEYPASIAVDGSGNSFVLGTTISKNFTPINSNYTIPTGGTSAFLVEVNSSGSVTYKSYVGGLFLLNSYENLANQPLGFLRISQILPFMIGIGLVVVVAFLGIYTAEEYRKYAKTTKNTQFTSRISFKTYLKSKFTRSKRKSNSKTILSNEIFEKLEEIEKENAPKE